MNMIHALCWTGVYAVKFWKNGRWRCVIVDDYIPCSEASGTPLYAHSRYSYTSETAYLLLDQEHNVILDSAHGGSRFQKFYVWCAEKIHLHYGRLFWKRLTPSTIARMQTSLEGTSAKVSSTANALLTSLCLCDQIVWSRLVLSIIALLFASALVDLSGPNAACEEVPLGNVTNVDALWSKLVRYDQSKFLMV